MRAVFVLVSAVLLLVGSVQATAAQPTHGEIITVNGNQARVQLADSLTVDDSTEGRVVQERTVSGRTVQMTFALVRVEEVERPREGPWIAVCEILRRSEDIEIGNGVRFDAVEQRSTLIVESDPEGAEVRADGRRLGTTPVTRVVPGGTYELTVAREGYAPATLSVAVEPGTEKPVDVSLRKTEGTLAANTLPDSATVTLGTTELGQTPLETRVQTGTDTITIQREGYLPVVREVEIREDDTTQVNATLRRPLHVELAEEQGEAVANVQMDRDRDRLVVEYDLVGGSKKYEVRLLLSTNGGKTFEALPKTVSGEVGEDITPGSDKTVVWAVLDDFPKGFKGPGYQLRVATDAQGGRGILWVIGSAVVAGGGATAAALLGAFGGGGGGGGDGGLPDSPPQPPQ